VGVGLAKEFNHQKEGGGEERGYDSLFLLVVEGGEKKDCVLSFCRSRGRKKGGGKERGGKKRGCCYFFLLLTR